MRWLVSRFLINKSLLANAPAKPVVAAADSDDEQIPTTSGKSVSERTVAGGAARADAGAADLNSKPTAELTAKEVMQRELADAERARDAEEAAILSGSLRPGETGTERIWRHVKAEPWVAIGATATAGVLIGGFFFAYLPGKRHLYQRIWWTRIGLQAFTATSLVAGMLYREHNKQKTEPAAAAVATTAPAIVPFANATGTNSAAAATAAKPAASGAAPAKSA